MKSSQNFAKKHPLIFNLILMALVAVVIGFLAMVFLDVWTLHGKTAIVPDVKNNSYATAASILESKGLKIEIADSIFDEKIAPGTVIESWPRAGAKVKPGREVYVTITSFQPRKVVIGMPLTGVSSRQAMSYLQSLDVKNIRVIYVPSQYDDLVEGAKYNGKNIVPGMEIPVTGVITLEVGSIPEDFFSAPTDSVSSSATDTDIATEIDDETSAALYD